MRTRVPPGPENGNGTDEKSGLPAAKWTSLDGLYQLHYVFHPESIEVKVTRSEQAPAFKLDFSKLDIDGDEYSYAVFADGEKFGFRKRSSEGR